MKTTRTQSPTSMTIRKFHLLGGLLVVLKKARLSPRTGSGSPSSELPQPSPTTTSSGSCSRRSSQALVGALVCLVNGCKVRFAGKYAKGNCARHRRQFHGVEPKVITCEESGCMRTFKRKDARLKHYRKHHPHRADDAVQRGAQRTAS